VILNRGEHECPAVTLVSSNVFITVINIYFALAVKDADLLADIVVRNTVIMFVLTKAYIVVL
jgi:hypothetical protein